MASEFASTNDVTRAILSKIQKQGSTDNVDSEDLRDVIFAMNSYMLALDAQGITLGYTKVSGGSDPITVPPGALRGLVGNVAIEIAPDFNATISGGLTKMAQEGFDAMLDLGTSLIEVQLPNTLPIGSGNRCNGLSFSQFFHDNPNTILSEISGNISLEDDTNAQAGD